MKFSDNYIETKIIKHQRIIDNNISFIEYEERNIIKELIPSDKYKYYVWGNIGNAMIFNINCKTNDKIIKIKNLCFNIEKLIKNNDIYIATLEIKNILLPLLDKLTNEEIQIIKNNNRETAGPLYEYYPNLSTPDIFIELFK